MRITPQPGPAMPTRVQPPRKRAAHLPPAAEPPANKRRGATRPAGPAIPQPPPAAPAPVQYVMFNLEDVVGPKSTYPKVEYLVVRGFSLAKAEALVRALRQLAKYFKQFLLDHESGILVKAEVPGATRKRILPGKWLKEVFYVNDEEYKAGIYKTNVSVVVPFAGILFVPEVEGMLTNISCTHAAPPLCSLLLELGVIPLGIRIRSAGRGDDDTRSDQFGEYIEVCPNVLVPAPNGGVIEVCRGQKGNNNMSGAAVVERAEPAPAAEEVEEDEEEEATEVIDPRTTNAPEPSLPPTPVSQPAIPRLVPASSEWQFFPEPIFATRWSVDSSDAYLSEELPSLPAVTYSAAHAAEMAAAAWRESIVPLRV